MRRGGLKLGGELEIVPRPSDIIRFMKKIRVVDGCWQWIGGKDENGYGYFWVGSKASGLRSDGKGRKRAGRNISAHRFAVALFQGRIAAGNDVDHCATEECIGHACVNPFKCLKQKTRAENSRDGSRRQKQNLKKLPGYVKNIKKLRDRDDIPF